MINDQNKSKISLVLQPSNLNSSNIQQNNTNVKKFNTKGYFHQVQPYSQEYLKKKHQTYSKYRDKEDKQNFVYNLTQQRMPIGYYRIKGYHIDKKKSSHNDNKQNKKHIKSINQNKLDSKQLEYLQEFHQKSQKIIIGLYKKYIERKQKLTTKSQKGIMPIFLTCNKSQIESRIQSRASNYSIDLFKLPKTQTGTIHIPKRRKDSFNNQNIPLRSHKSTKLEQSYNLKTQNSRQQYNQTSGLSNYYLGQHIKPKNQVKTSKGRRRLKTLD